MREILTNKRFIFVGGLEVIERLAWYSFYFTVAYYFINTLGFSEKESMLLKGAVGAMLYAGNAVGGLIADRLLGVRRTLFIAIASLAIGYCLVGSFAGNLSMVIIGMAFVTIGGFLFKPQPLSLLVSIYKDPSQRDSAVTLYYQFVNIGSLIAATFVPVLIKFFGYFVAYGLVGISMIAGGIIIFINRKIYGEFDNHLGVAKLPAGNLKKFVGIFLVLFAFLTFVFTNPTLSFVLLLVCAGLLVLYFVYQANKIEEIHLRHRALSVLPMIFLGVVFFVMYEQMDSSALLFTLHHSNTTLFGYEMDSQSVSGTLNSAGIIILAPLMAVFYNSKIGQKLTVQHKFVIGLLMSTVMVATLWLATFSVDPSEKISIYWLVFSITILFSGGELLVSALGAAALSALVPERMRGFAIGLWFLSSALGIKLGAWLSSLVAHGENLGGVVALTGQNKINSFLAYQQLYGWLFVGCLVTTLIGAAIAFKVARVVKESERYATNTNSIVMEIK